MTRDEVERFVLDRVRADVFKDPWRSVVAIVDALVFWRRCRRGRVGGRRRGSMTRSSRRSWRTRCGRGCRGVGAAMWTDAEFFIEGVVVDRAEVDTSTIEWVVTNAHAEVQREMFARAGVDGDVVLLVSVNESTEL